MQRALLTLIFLLSQLSLFSPACAQDRMEHGRWSSQFLDGMGEATTHENGVATFGMLCAMGRCRYYFANGIDCEPGGNYPFMITTDSGALPIEAVCEPVSTANGDILVYWFNENQAMNQALQTTPVAGFAFPLTNGQFRLNSFSMEGFSDAVDRMVNGLRQQQGMPAGGESQELQMEIQEATPSPVGDST